jgi:L-aspartate oxidase
LFLPDFVIVGSGIAGLRAAMSLAPAGRVLILTKADPGESNTGYAQGGIAAAIDSRDSPALHASDTIRAGDGLCDEAAVRILCEEGPQYVRELIDWGTRFDRDEGGRVALGLEAAHSVRRILHAGDSTGREIGRTLWERVRTHPGVETVNHAFVTGLIAEGEVVAGVEYLDREGRPQQMRAARTLLATGGAGQVFRETTNPAVATGDGIALAYEAGARVCDLEFVQFHPTALSHPAAPRFLISEAVRGEGARLVNGAGEAFMTRYHPDADLAPRDVVARSIVREAARTGGPVFLTLAHLTANVRDRFPTIAAMCRQVGLDLAKDRIPVGPAAHYVMGGIETDEWARTSLRGLYAAGETACTGVHGANRLASNSLLEGLVFGARAAVAMQQPPAAAARKPDRVEARGWGLGAGGWGLGDGGWGLGTSGLRRQRSQNSRAEPRAPSPESRAPSPQPPVPSPQDIRDLMWRSAGLFRTREALDQAVGQLDAAYVEAKAKAAAERSSECHRLFNLAIVARLIARAALRREESRGGHYREDFPERDDLHWKVHLTDERDNHG